MKLYNTLSRTIEDLKPLNPPYVTFYSCGPTVYDFTHLGHMRTYVNNDILKRILNYLGYKVKHVMNITDVGHLSGDDDSGEDKMEKGAKKYGKTVWDVAQFYTDFFFKTTDALNIIRPDVICKATEHIKDMINLIDRLNLKGFVYQTDEAVYFDVTKFKNYGKLSGQKLSDKIEGARQEVNIDLKKKNPADFALWFKRVGRFSDHTMHWKSTWGDGFPGWHIECSAMSMKYLGDTIDIHTGGIDHIPVHHENEIAQSEAATEKTFVNCWVHFNFLTVEGQKMSKSLNNFLTINDISKKNIDPLALRLLFLQTHYRQSFNFTWKSAGASQEALNKLKNIALKLKDYKVTGIDSLSLSEKAKIFQKKFKESIENDLQTPQAVAVMWEMLKSDIPDSEKNYLLNKFDKVFGLKLAEVTEVKIPDEIIELAKKRQMEKKNHNYAASDVIRDRINSSGYDIEDLKDGFKIKKF